VAWNADAPLNAFRHQQPRSPYNYSVV